MQKYRKFSLPSLYCTVFIIMFLISLDGTRVYVKQCTTILQCMTHFIDFIWNNKDEKMCFRVDCSFCYVAFFIMMIIIILIIDYFSSGLCWKTSNLGEQDNIFSEYARGVARTFWCRRGEAGKPA